MSKKVRVIETLKTWIIVVLTCSALWLIKESRVFQVVSVLGGSQHSTGAAGTQTAPTRSVLPVHMAVMSQGGCCGIQYGSEELSTVFDSVAPLLNEAISGVDTLREITQEDWKRMLTSAPGVYFDFQGNIPLSVLAGWLSGEENTTLTAYARHLVLTVDEEDTVVLACRDEENDRYLAGRTRLVSLDHLQSAVAQIPPNGAVFAGQAANYSMLAPWTIINAQTPQPREYAASNPLLVGDEDRLDDLLTALSFPLGITTIYETPEGCRARSGNDTLSISNDGMVTYHSTREEERYPILQGEGESEFFAAVDGAARFARGVMDLWRGEGRICLEQVEERGDGSLWLAFRYILDDIPVQMGQQGYAATVLVERGYITEFEFQLRTYTPLEQHTLLLPQAQAAAVLANSEQTGSRMELRYQDNGDVVRAGWVAN